MKFLCVVSILLVFTNANEYYPCYEETDQYWYFPLKTTYKSVSSKEIELPESNCIPVKLFMVIRNGTSNVSKHFIEEHLSEIHPYRNIITENAKMCQTDIEAIKNWKSIFERKELNYKCLTKNGREEIHELALRIKNTFLDIFSKPQNSDNYNILVMPNENCQETGEIFIQTIFGSTNIDKFKADDKDNQILEKLEDISFTIKKLTDYYSSEMVKFGKSNTMKNVVQRIADKMGIEPEEIKGIIKIMYDVCGYERSYAEKVIPAWCRVFCQEDLEVLEYYDDLYWYYAIGYGHNENGRWACPLAIRLLDSFKTTFFLTDTGPYGTINFTSHEFVLSMYFLLGIGKNEKRSKKKSDREIIMDSSNYHSMKDRNWRTSLFSPWAANVTAVYFKCNYNWYSPTLYKIAFYFNEKIVAVPMKGGSTCEVCLWPVIEEKINIFIHNYKCHKFLEPENKEDSNEDSKEENKEESIPIDE
ncbi:multiple inositol polyphosphate phosphatase 1-like [Adelges cooleyi]|uniref:multiple inositol polyphosphate phosphatase 1-like n=1 Tax=Adelges cooleyi TaxID=133065 RepID=UPI00217FA687|nr:multiple inositol polyphosphate phosphatase 1-like [Adelges cooleyi]